MQLERDITQRIDEKFSELSRSSVHDELTKLAAVREIQRVVRCVLFLANGDENKVIEFVAAALADYRDVIWWAEYDGKEVRLRDLSRPFITGDL